MLRARWFLSFCLLAVAPALTAGSAHAKPARTRKKPPPAKPSPTPAPADGPDEETRSLRRGERVEFDARLIQGQTAKAGAVYLFERASTELSSMVLVRRSFRDAIVRPVFPRKRGRR